MPDVHAPARTAAGWAVVAALVITAGCSPGGAPQASPTGEPSVAATSSTLATSDETTSVTSALGAAHRGALAVLRDWDSRRAEAYASGDLVALRRLHVRGSPLAAQDVAVLRRYRAQGLRVTRLQQQVVSVEVRVAGARAVTLSVVERLALGKARPAGRHAAGSAEWTLPTSRFQRRVLRFERVGGTWRLSWARAA